MSGNPLYSIKAEQSVLGGLMLDNTKFDVIKDMIVPSDFFDQDHKNVFYKIMELHEKNLSFDFITMSDNSDIPLHYLAKLMQDTPSAANILSYAEIVIRTAKQRKIIAIAGELLNKASESPDAAFDAIEKLQQITSRGQVSQNVRHIKTVLAEVIDDIEAAIENGGAFTGLSTGIDLLDKMTNGFEPGLIIIAGRPSMGKTSLSEGILEFIARKTDRPVLCASLETSDKILARRGLSRASNVELTKLRTGKLEENDWPNLTTGIKALSSAPIYYADCPGATIDQIRQIAINLKKELGDLAILAIDYLQLLSALKKTPSSANKTQIVTDNADALKNLTMELNIPIIAISQLNREVEKRPNKRPLMADLRESGAIEQAADLIIFVYRDEVYNEESQDRGIAELITAKQKEGQLGTIKVKFAAPFTRFENLHYSPGDYE